MKVQNEKWKLSYILILCTLSSFSSFSCGRRGSNTLSPQPGWAKSTISGTGSTSYNSLSVGADGSIYAAGHISGTQTYGFSNSVMATGIAPGVSLILVKYDSSGNSKWAKTITAGNSENKYLGVAVGPDGSIYAAGYLFSNIAYSFGNNVTVTPAVNGRYNLILVKYNSSGIVQWAKTVLSGSLDSKYLSVGVGADGGIYAAGYITGNAAYALGSSVSAIGSASSSNPNAVLVKYDSSGNVLWARSTATGSNDSKFYSVAVGPDGSVYAGGLINGTGTYGFGNSVSTSGSSSGSSVSNLVLVKYSSTGNAQWAKSSVSGNGPSSYSGVAVGADGTVYAAGSLSGSSAYGFENSVSATGSSTGSNLLLASYNPSGSIQWAKTTVSGTSDSAYNGVTVGADGGVYAGGSIFGNSAYGFGNSVTATGPAVSDTNIVLVKYDSSGNVQSATTVVSGVSASLYNGIAGSSNGNIYCAGYITGINPYGFGSSGSASGSSSGSSIVLVKY